MYHSVVEDPGRLADSLDGISHSRQVFEEQMELLAREFHPIPLDQVRRFVLGHSNLPQRSVVISFDDGYADNYDIALPILDRLGIPSVFYVTVDCVERRTMPWPSRLRYSFRRTKKKSWTDPEGKRWSMEKADSREQAFLTACDRVCQLAGTALENCLTTLEEELDAKLPNDSGQLMITWEQIRNLARRGHIVGSHTMTHPNMAYLRNEDATREFADSKKRIEMQMNAPIEHFAYPCPALFPSWSQETVEGSRLAGYQTAVTTNRGPVRKGHEPLLLNRVPPSKTIDGLRWNLEKAFAERAG